MAMPGAILESRQKCPPLEELLPRLPRGLGLGHKSAVARLHALVRREWPVHFQALASRRGIREGTCEENATPPRVALARDKPRLSMHPELSPARVYLIGLGLACATGVDFWASTMMDVAGTHIRGFAR